MDSLRREGFDGEIFLVTEEDQPPYQRPPLSKDYLAGRYGLDRVLLRPEAFYGESSIELVTGAKVASIDPGAHRIELATGRTLDYDRLLLATGSRVRRLDGMPGADLEGVLYLRTVEDSDRIRAAMEGAERLAVVGGGYIGLRSGLGRDRGGPCGHRGRGAAAAPLTGRDRRAGRVLPPTFTGAGAWISGSVQGSPASRAVRTARSGRWPSPAEARCPPTSWWRASGSSR